MPRGQRRVEIAKRGRTTTLSERDEPVALPEIIGCPVLDPINCQCPKDEIGAEEGVKMTCTWELCPFASRPLHTICYQMLEDNLVRRLATLGSARGWTVPQRRNNLWERKGQALIGKFCRCRCDRGQMTRDKQALYEKERAVEKEKKKKARKAKQLPQLQFNSKPSAALEDKKRENEGLMSPSGVSRHNRTYSNTTRSRLFTDRSNSSIRTFTMPRTWSESSFAGETSTCFDDPSFVHPPDCQCVFHDDYDADELLEELEHDIVDVPSPFAPAPLTKSYAATIKSSQTPSKNGAGDMEHKKKSDSPDSGLERSTPPPQRVSLSISEVGSVPAEFPELHESESLNPLGLSIMNTVDSSLESSASSPSSEHFPLLTSTPHLPKKLRAGASVSESKLPLALLIGDEEPEPEEPRCGFSFRAPIREMMDSWQATFAKRAGAQGFEKGQLVYGWTPFFGQDFNLGERLYYMP